MLWGRFTRRPQSLRTGSWKVPSASWISMNGVPWSVVCQTRAPSAISTNWNGGYLVFT